MSGRGRGRYSGGRGGRGGFGAKQESFVLFPEVEIPDRKDVDVKEESELFFWKSSPDFLEESHDAKSKAKTDWWLHDHWKSSPYFLEESHDAKKGQSMDIERYSEPKTTWERGSLDQFLQLGSNNFPKELYEGLEEGNAKKKTKKKVPWDPGSDLQKLDNWEQNEKKGEGKDKVKKEGEEEEEEEEDDEEAEDEDDYNKFENFDDDEDDFNADDDE